MRTRITSLIIFFALFFHLTTGLWAARFEREDWIYTTEPTHPQYWGIEWGINNLMLPYRILQRGKRFVESRTTNNWKFKSKSDGATGKILRSFSTIMELGIFFGSINLHHTMGHDAAAREQSLRFGVPGVPSKYSQVLSNFFGGHALANSERNIAGGPDYQTQSLVQPMQAEIHFGYEQGKTNLRDEPINSAEALNYFLYRVRFYLDRFQEDGLVDQGYVDYDAKSYGSLSQLTSAEIQKYSGNKTYSTDFTHYIIELNRRRYGVSQVSQFRTTMEDIYKTYYYQLLDPLQWITLWQYSKDYIYYGRDQTHIPMVFITENLQYLPALRTYFGPLGTVYYIDNYFRYRKTLFNLYGLYGNNGYEKSSGFGIDIPEFLLWRKTRVGVFGEYHKQPHLSRLLDRTPLTPSEIGQTHAAYNLGATIKFPIYFLETAKDSSSILVYLRGGTKNDGWIPGEYLKGGAYLQIGLGLHY